MTCCTILYTNRNKLPESTILGIAQHVTWQGPACKWWEPSSFPGRKLEDISHYAKQI